GSRVSACGKYADLCRQRTARTTVTRTTATTTATTGQPKAVMAYVGSRDFNYYEWWNNTEKKLQKECRENDTRVIEGINCTKWLKSPQEEQVTNPRQSSGDHAMGENAVIGDGVQEVGLNHPAGEKPNTVIEGQGHQQREEDTLEEVKARGSTKHEVELKGPVSAGLPTTSVASTPNQTQATHTLPQSDQGASSHQNDNTVIGGDQPIQQSSPAVNVTAAPDSQENSSTNETTDTSASGTGMGVSTKTETEENTSTSSPRPENATTEAPTTTPSPVPVPNAEISSTIASNMQNKANVDSSVSPVWMRTAAPLLIVAVLVSITVY
ncbi:uncharacterized protein TM35_000861040, partial [Trypanosoma theileri]